MQFRVKITLSWSGWAAPLHVINGKDRHRQEHMEHTNVHAAMWHVFIITKDSLAYCRTHNPKLSYTLEHYLSKTRKTQPDAKVVRAAFLSLGHGP